VDLVMSLGGLNGGGIVGVPVDLVTIPPRRTVFGDSRYGKRRISRKRSVRMGASSNGVRGCRCYLARSRSTGISGECLYIYSECAYPLYIKAQVRLSMGVHQQSSCADARL
jgi:hypothetical protein